MEFKTFHACEIAYIYLLIYARWDGKGWRWWKSWVILHGKSRILNPRQFLIFYDAKIGRCWKTYVQTENPHSMIRDQYRIWIFSIVSICRLALYNNIFISFHLYHRLKRYIYIIFWYVESSNIDIDLSNFPNLIHLYLDD